MLTLFPELLTYGLVAPFLLRISIGFVLINLGYLSFKGERKQWENVGNLLRIPEKVFASGYGVFQIAGGIFFVIGLWTQAFALLFSALFLAELLVEYREESILKRELAFYLLLFVISLSLLFSGAGFFAFDIPL
ncbi:MAG: DoxX family membrane protein [Patescibacteria group bacterium]|nr:DoxX family membrane protein [bacterium]MDZ4240980.1 DoxX family membrane protein [Patescibacteria group bacterium]